MNWFRKMPIGLSLSFVALLIGCSSRTDSESPLGWPDGPVELVKHLNSWDRDALKAYSLGESSEETHQWVTRHLYELEKLGYKCQWDETTEQFLLKK